VRRLGDTNGALTVPYGIGGTASNGVDYVALPGSMMIPDGERRAFISIVPIDDDNGSSNAAKTVILSLPPDTNVPPAYVLNFPRTAEALILEDWPRPLPFVLPDRSFHVNAAGPDGAWFCVQYSTDALNWTTVCTNQVLQGSIDFVDPDAANHPSRFYRAVPVNTVPAN
jgi:hypothetical protein